MTRKTKEKRRIFKRERKAWTKVWVFLTAEEKKNMSYKKEH